jgi:hypothetical protein
VLAALRVSLPWPSQMFCSSKNPRQKHCCVVKWGSGMGAVYPGDEYED